LVLDASVALSWFFEDQATRATDAVFRRVMTEGAAAPSVWPWEVANVLVKRARSARLPADLPMADAKVLGVLLAQSKVVIDPAGGDAFTHAMALAIRHTLSSYDAAYLELALRLGLPLATLDRALIRAAQAEGVAVLPGPET
jgi:predicted nucleic acid-binding protein